MTTESHHTCVLDHSYPNGIMACACGRFWIEPGRELLRFAFVSGDLRSRLRSHQTAIRWGDADDMAAAVFAAAQQARENRDAAREKLRAAWPRTKATKQAKWYRRVRAIVLESPCAYCGAAATEIDHIVPVSRGGPHVRRNFAASCSPCNSEKGNRTPDEWKAWRLNLGRTWPPVRTEAAA